MATNSKDEKNDEPLYPPPPPDFDPFDLEIRDVAHPTSDCETLMNVLKSCFGTGILSMPAAFMAAGYLVSFVLTVVISIMCTHCACILVVSTHALYYRTGKTSMTYTEVAEVSCLVGPKWSRKFACVLKDCETLLNLLKECLGSGVLSMPTAFSSAGIIVSFFGVVIIAVMCTHCAYILVNSTHALYFKTGLTKLNYAQVAEVACVIGPKWSKKFGVFLKNTVLYGIFITYFTTCSCYAVIVASNFEQILSYYLDMKVNLRLILTVMVIPSILLCYIPDLKYLAPFSLVANVFMGVGLGITMYYLVIDLPPLSDRRMTGKIEDFPVFYSITLFALEAIGVMIPSANNMKTPTHFTRLFGVLNIGMVGVTTLYILIGFMGYYKYGDATLGAITLNLPENEILAQSVKILIALAVFFTYGLQFYIALDILWETIKHHFPNRPRLANYILRTVLAIVAILIAIALPQITPFVGIIGAFCFSILGIIVPIFIEIITFWDNGFGRLYWKIWKDIIIILAGIGALIFGTRAAIMEIIEKYSL